MKFKMHLKLFTLVLACMVTSSCVSAWMAGSTGVSIKRGMSRDEVHQKLGPPSSAGGPKNFDIRGFSNEKKTVRLVDVHLYRGKINSVDEGGGQAIANALTLGTAEVIMIPMTAAEIAVRSGQNHRIDVAYGDDLRVLDYTVKDPPKN